MMLHKAKRNKSFLKIGLSGASGNGKTYSALLLAYGMVKDWGKIAVIDTENGSSNLYSHLGDFNVLQLEAPYSPENYINAIKTCESASLEVIIIDSISHEWKGKGGCLEMHKNLGGRFQDWRVVTPKHQAFIDKILTSKCHIITTVRRRMEYVLDVDDKGKRVVNKMGTKEETRNGWEYELTINFEIINGQHLAKATKDRTGLFLNKPRFVISSSTGEKLKHWWQDGLKLEEIYKEIETTTTIDGLKHLYGKYPAVQNGIIEGIMKRKSEIEATKQQINSKRELVQPENNQENGSINK